MSAIYDYLALEPLSSEPLYRQLVGGFERFCAANEPGTPVPPERELCDVLGISRTSLRRALGECVERNLLVKKWAKGIFVADKVQQKRILLIMPESMECSMPWNYTLPGIEERASELGFTLERTSTPFLRSQTTVQLTAFLERENFTGILHMDYQSWYEAQELEALRQTPIPVLFPHAAEHWSEKDVFPVVCVNEKEAFADAARALVAAGHKRFVSLLPASTEPYFIRGFSAEEYQAFLAEIGADSSAELWLQCVYKEHRVNEVIDRFLDKKIDFSAILCFSDFFAIEALNALSEHNLRVPQDVSLMGFCGFSGGKFLDPALSTIDFDYHAIGRNAVDRVLSIPRNWQKNLAPSEKMVYSPYKKVMRQSVKPINIER